MFAGYRNQIPRWRMWGLSMSTPEFLPTDIAGLQLWLDFSDVSTLFIDAAKTIPVTADGDVIGAVEDKSGSGNDATQGTTANKPLHRTLIQNGLSVGRFDGIDDQLVTSLSQAQPNTLYVVRKPDRGDAVEDFFGNFGGSVALLRTSSAVQILIFAGVALLTAAIANTLIWNIQTAVYNGASSQLWFNGALEASGNPGANGFVNIRISVALGFLGDAGEVLLYSGLHSDIQRDNVLNYLNNKWAIF